MKKPLDTLPTPGDIIVTDNGWKGTCVSQKFQFKTFMRFLNKHCQNFILKQRKQNENLS